MDSDVLYRRYQDLQQYVRWTLEDAHRVHSMAALLRPHFTALVEDFYGEIERHPEAKKVITGGQPQIDRLKGTLHRWLEELFSGRYDADYVARRWQVGWRHVEIGLDQVYTNAALSRLRNGLLLALDEDSSPGSNVQHSPAVRHSLNKLLDLDLAIIEDAYQTEFQRRQQSTERLATIGQIAGGVAHELRNPLNVVKTSVYYLLNAKNPSEEKTRTHLERIERQVDMADGVITALNNFARLPVPEMGPLLLDALMNEVLENHDIPSHVEVALDFPAGLPPVLGDAQQLKIVFGNLLRNAREAMSEGGTLRIAARQHPNGVEVSVSDTGIGIRPEDLGRVMEPLYSTKSRGIGLGLAITKAIVDKHNGHLSVDSAPGRGTTFTVRLTTNQSFFETGSLT